jgi:hypothetical protein
MVEFITQIVVHTPLWVWAMFIFLLSRGIKARKPATVTLEKLAIIPAIFLIWDIYDLLSYRGLSFATCALWLVGLLSGAPCATWDPLREVTSFRLRGRWSISLYAILV